MAADIDFSGLIDLEYDLGRASATTITRSSVAIAKTAHDIERDAKLNAPVDTGALRSSISTTARGLTAEIGPTVDYAQFVEEGTSRQAPQPYMRPAAEKNIPGLVDALGQIVGDIL